MLRLFTSGGTNGYAQVVHGVFERCAVDPLSAGNQSGFAPPITRRRKTRVQTRVLWGGCATMRSLVDDSDEEEESDDDYEDDDDEDETLFNRASGSGEYMEG